MKKKKEICEHRTQKPTKRECDQKRFVHNAHRTSKACSYVFSIHYSQVTTLEIIKEIGHTQTHTKAKRTVAKRINLVAIFIADPYGNVYVLCASIGNVALISIWLHCVNRKLFRFSSSH